MKVLNGRTATLVALVLFNFVSHTIRGKSISILAHCSFVNIQYLKVFTKVWLIWYNYNEWFAKFADQSKFFCHT